MNDGTETRATGADPGYFEGGVRCVGLRRTPARVARQIFFSLSFLEGSGIAFMGSLRVSNGGALGKSCMHYGRGPRYRIGWFLV